MTWGNTGEIRAQSVVLFLLLRLQRRRNPWVQRARLQRLRSNSSRQMRSLPRRSNQLMSQPPWQLPQSRWSPRSLTSTQ